MINEKINGLFIIFSVENLFIFLKQFRRVSFKLNEKSKTNIELSKYLDEKIEVKFIYE
jgi:hypothetical protein